MITAKIASLPKRERLLKRTVESLRPQVDNIFVALNGYQHTPDFLDFGEYVHLDNSTGDAAKFYDIENINGYVLTCDDDLIYPPNYVSYMIRGLHRHNAITTLHGKVYPRPVTTFKNTKLSVQCLRNLYEDVKVEVPGTGVLCFHTDMIDLNYKDFKLPNMADIWMGKFAHEQNVDIVALAHDASYLTYQHPNFTVYKAEKKKGFELQNKLLQQTFNKWNAQYDLKGPKQRYS